jgi:hypothetical protein
MGGTMKAHELDELRAHAKDYARTFGVFVELYISEDETSPVSVGGARIELFVFREVPGQPPREHPLFNYRLDVADLRTRIERDIKRAAQKLYAPEQG